MSNGLQLDFKRLDFSVWRDPSFTWTETMEAELAHGWAALDRSGEIGRIIEEKTHYDDTTRMGRLDEAFIRSHDEPGRAWNIEEWMRKHRER